MCETRSYFVADFHYETAAVPLHCDTHFAPSKNTVIPVPFPAASPGFLPLLAKANVPALTAAGSAATVYDGNTGGPVKVGDTALLRNTSRQVPLPSDTI
jgi:hypothetical protein